MKTFSRRGLETSMPTTGLPGMGASTRTESARSAIERSSARVTMRFTLTPGAGSNSKVVITGPGRTATTLPLTWKSASLVSRMRGLVERLRRAHGRVEEVERREAVGVLGEQLLLELGALGTPGRLGAALGLADDGRRLVGGGLGRRLDGVVEEDRQLRPPRRRG